MQGYFAVLCGKRVTYFGRQGDQHTEWFSGAAPAKSMGERSGEIGLSGAPRGLYPSLRDGRGQEIVGSFQQVRTMAGLTSYQSDIRPLFTERDIRAMSKAFNLASYDDVKAHAAAIYDRIRGIGGAVMPPPPPRGEGPWPQDRIDLFARWMADGYQP